MGCLDGEQEVEQPAMVSLAVGGTSVDTAIRAAPQAVEWAIPEGKDDLAHLLSAARRCTKASLGGIILGADGYPRGWSPFENPWLVRKKHGRNADGSDWIGGMRLAFEDIIEKSDSTGKVADFDPPELAGYIGELLASTSRSYTLILTGMLLTKSQYESVDVSLPMQQFGEGYFPARAIDEKIVMPTLEAANFAIEMKTSAYLAVGKKQLFHMTHVKGADDERCWKIICKLASIINYTGCHECGRWLAYLLACMRETTANPSTTSASPAIKAINPCVAFTKALICPAATAPGKVSAPWMLQIVTTAVLDALSLDIKSTRDARVMMQELTASDAASGLPGDATLYVDGKAIFCVDATMTKVSEFKYEGARRKLDDFGILNYVIVNLDGANSVDPKKQTSTSNGSLRIQALPDFLKEHLAPVTKSRIEPFMDSLHSRFSDPQTKTSLRSAWNRAVSEWSP